MMADENNSIVDQFGFDDDMNMSIDSNPEASTDEEKVRKLIEEDLKNCSFDDLELKIFSVACPILRQNFVGIIEQIEKKLDDEKSMKNARAFDDLFVRCQSALEPWSILMNHVLRAGKSCEPAKLVSLIDNFPSVAIKISGHCKTNRQKYPRELLPPLLSDVFKKSCGIVKIFCNILSSIIKFSGSDDFDVLRKVLRELGEIARLTTYDLVTMGQSWKTFMKLGVTHKDIILSKNCIEDIRSHFKHLGGIINSLYNNILKSSVELFEKRAKCTIFLLTILDRLHVIFCKANQPSDEFLKEMIPILINLSANHAICTGTKLKDHENNLHRARIKIITQNFAESIAKHYTGFNNFWKILQDEFEVIKKNRQLKYAIGYHAIVLSILESVKPGNVFFDIAIQNIVYLQEEMVIGSLEFITVNNDQKNIYDATLSVLIDFLIKKNEEFDIYEIILMKNLMSEAFWPSLMSHDILTCLYKKANEELAVIHIQQFLSTYEVLRGRDDSLAVVILSRLIINIYELLSNESKEEVLKNCNNYPNSLLLILKSRSSDESIKNKQLALYQKITAVEPVNSLAQVIADLRRQPTLENWNRMVQLLQFMGISKEKTNRVNGEKLCEISAFLMGAMEEMTGWKRRMLVDVVMLLFDCAEIDGDEECFNWALISVLFSRVARSSNLPSEFLIRVCHYLSRNAHRLNSTTEDNIPVLSNLFCVLLEDNNDFVRQEALEAYDHVVETCGNDDLIRKITKIIAQRPKLRKIVPAYLKKEILEEIPNFEDYLRNLCRKTVDLVMERKHSCRDEEEEEEQDEKRLKTDADDYEKQAEDVCSNLKLLAREKNSLSLNVRKKLRNACLLFVGDD